MENFLALQELINNIEQDIGLEKIRKFGRVNGFQNNLFRKYLWKKLLDIKDNTEYIELPHCQQFDQLKKDVNRSLNTITQAKQFKEIEKLRNCLLEILDTIFSQNKNYSYYQGYHDIVSIFILVLGVDQGFIASTFAANNFFKDYLNQELANSLNPQLEFVHHILKRYARDTSDHQLSSIMNIIHHLTCVIPWILTWFSHSLENIDDICRMWDFLLSSNQNMILYVSAAVIIIHKTPLDPRYEDDLIGDFQELFQNLNNKERITDFKLETILKLSIQLERQYKFEKILEQSNIKFYQESLIYQRNFTKELEYYKQLEQVNNSLLHKLKNKIYKQQDFLLFTSGIILSAIIQKSIFLK